MITLPVPSSALYKPLTALVQKVDPPKPIAVVPITYTVVDGDSLISIADAHTTTYQRLYDKNLSISNPNEITPGEVLTIPTSDEVLVERAMIDTSTQVGVVAKADKPSSGGFSVSGNLYTPGNCTWYVKNLRPDIPNNWGNADTWYDRAASDGYGVGYTPRIGAIAVAISYVHVAIVTGISGETVTVQEMNYKGLYIVDTRTAPISEFRYIY